MLRKADFVKRIGALLCIVMANAVLWGNSALAFGPTGTRLSASSGDADKSSETALVYHTVVAHPARVMHH